MRATGLAVTAGVIAITVCGCGIRSATTAERDPVGSVARPIAALRSADPVAWAKAQARMVARRLLGRQPLPPGAIAEPRPAWPRLLQAAGQIGNRTDSIDLTKVFLVPRSETQVIGFLRSHLPGDSVNSGYGRVSSASASERFVDYMLASAPAGVGGTLLVASTLPATGGRTWVRIDAEAVWRSPRSAAEHRAPGRYLVDR